jgi:hypothetical protein
VPSSEEANECLVEGGARLVRMKTYQDDDSEGTGRHESVHPVFDLVERDVESGGDDTALVDSTIELDDDLSRTVVIDVFEFVNVA